MSTDRTLRFSGLEWYEPIQNKKVLIVGAGGIGSWTALFLSRIFIGTNLRVVDFDVIDEYNLAGQFYSRNSIGSSKAETLQREINNFGGNIDIGYGRVEEYNDSFLLSFDYIISAVDNMTARKYLYTKIKAYNTRNSRLVKFIDGRLLAESYQIFTVDCAEKLELYERVLFDDSEAKDAACSMKATSHCGASIGVDITGLLINMVTNDHYKDDVRDVPFMITKHFDLMMYDTEIPKIFQTQTV